MQPFGVDGEAMMRSGANSGCRGQDDRSEQSCGCKFQNGKPVFRAVDAAAGGGKHEFEKSFHLVFQTNVMPTEPAAIYRGEIALDSNAGMPTQPTSLSGCYPSGS